MTEVLEYPPLVDAPSALTPIAVASRSAITIKEAAVTHLRAQEPTILALVERYRAVALVLDTPKGLAAGQAALTEVRENGRFAVQRARDATKDLLNAAKKDVEIEADRLIALIKPTEEHIEGQVSARKAVLAAEKAERERLAAEAARVEAERVAHHRSELAKIASYPDQARGQPAAKLAGAIEFVRNLTFGPEWEEFCDDAANARDDAVAKLTAMHTAAVAQEAEAARLEAQRVENARVAAEQAETQRKLDEQAAALKQRQDDIDRMERKAQERRDAEAKPQEYAPQDTAALLPVKAEPIAEAPAPASVAETPAPVVEAPALVPVSSGGSYRMAVRRAAPTPPKNVDIATPAELRAEWSTLEDALIPVFPLIVKHAEASDFARCLAALERMKAVFA